MLRVAWRSLRAHKSRLVLSTLAVVLGVAFVSGSFIFSDTLKKVFTDLFAQTTADVVVSPQERVSSDVEDASLTLPTSLVPKIAGVDGVAAVEGTVFVQGVIVLDADRKPVGAGGAPQFGVSWTTDPDLSPLTLVEGDAPTRADQVAIDSQTADKGDIAVGQQVEVVLPKGTPQKAEVVGVFRFGTSGSLAGASLTAFDSETAQRLLTAPGRVTEIDVKAEPGVSQEALASSVRTVVPRSVDVRTGAQVAEDDANDINQALSYFNTFILAFAAISLLVGIFLIINTFAMLAAQRARELALLRALGASRRQVSRSLLTEALVVGLIGSTIGFLLGILLAVGLKALLGVFGAELPAGSLVIAPRTVIACYVVGVVVTLVAAWFPARRASRVPPVAAMRDVVSIPARSLRIRTAIGSVVIVLGAWALLAGVTSDEADAGAALVGVGAMLTLVGVAVVAPVLARPFVAVLGWPIRRISALTGRIAVDNAGRNRTRTAGTASALMIGLAVVSTFTVLASSVNASIDATIDESFGADFTISASNFMPFSPAAAAAVRQVDGVKSATSLENVPVKVDGKGNVFTVFDPRTAPDAFKVTFDEGVWTSLDADSIALDRDAVKRAGRRIGDPMTVTFATGDRQVTLGAVYKATGLTGYVASSELVRAAGIPQSDLAVYVKLDAQADPASVRPELEKVLKAYPNLKLEDQSQVKQSFHDQVNTLLSFLFALLGLSILIAVLGIVNTLGLSVIERTREIGLLRAVGMSRTQVKRMIRWESAVIAIIGAVLGILLGILFGTALQNVLASQGMSTLSVPVPTLVLFALIAAGVGVLAAWLPSRRAARMDVLTAIASE